MTPLDVVVAVVALAAALMLAPIVAAVCLLLGHTGRRQGRCRR